VNPTTYQAMSRTPIPFPPAADSLVRKLPSRGESVSLNDLTVSQKRPLDGVNDDSDDKKRKLASLDVIADVALLDKADSPVNPSTELEEAPLSTISVAHPDVGSDAIPVVTTEPTTAPPTESNNNIGDFDIVDGADGVDEVKLENTTTQE
jgi:hypothetical protein